MSTPKQEQQGVYPKAVVEGESRSVNPSPNFPQAEEKVISYWDKDQTFEKSLKINPSGQKAHNEYVFFDGPPFANGLPHYGHLLTGYTKDVIPRYQTMKGRRVERVFGWDTHGLPAELEAQKELGFTNKDQIDKLGLAAFNDACRRSVMKYSGEWKEYVHRQARWVDFDGGYKTMNVGYMESVIWAFKQLYDKGLIYEGNRVLPYCPKDETPLSAHELRMDGDVYTDEQTATVVLGVRLRDEDAYLVYWTTTPWTVPSNMAVVVGNDIDYVEVQPVSGEFAGKKLYFAQARVADFTKELGEDYQVLRTLKGSELVGRRYYPAMPYLETELAKQAGAQPGENAYTVYAADYVDTEEGTGLVHQAPYGEDDMNTLKAHNIHVTDVTDDATRFTSLVPDYQGSQVFDANTPILRDLRHNTGIVASVPEDQRALLVQSKSMVHSYPRCWRCGTPLVYKPVTSWFVAVTKIKDQLLDVNEQINWIPENVKHGQFGKWLANARDWSITRNRYWGSPIPVWVSDDPAHPRIDVYGSLEELKRDFGRYPVDDKGEVNLHRPWIDELTRPNPDDPTGKSMMHRIPDVLDVWFDSGSMPFAQKHYPFENKEWFETHFPSDFVVEYVGQTRGWFYLLTVMSTALFGKPAFKNVVCHGIVLGDDGEKMSKHLHNYPDVNGVFNTYGSDAMRWFLMSSPILRGGNLIVTEKAIKDTVRQVLLPLWSSYYFFTVYANAANNGKGYVAKPIAADEVASLPQMDRYLLARLRRTILAMQKDLDTLAISDACDEALAFIDTLTNWYIRNSRERFWDEDTHAFDVLYTVLEAFTRAVAPLLPMEAEQIWRGLTGGESVHLANWPYVTEPLDAPSGKDSSNPDGPDTALGKLLVDDPELVEAMGTVRDIVSTALSLRKASKIRVRQPLARLTVVTENVDEVELYRELLENQLDVKAVELSSAQDADQHGLRLVHQLSVNARVAGPRLGKLVQFAIRGSKTGAWHQDPATGVVSVDGPDGAIALEPAEYTLTNKVEEKDEALAKETVSAQLANGGFVLLDTALTPELEQEGWARDTIRAVQDARKEAHLQVSDRIWLRLGVPHTDTLGIAAVQQFAKLICAETLANHLEVGTPDDPSATQLQVSVRKDEDE
ncbi:isoleucine--tRNA ligase [Aeriscardovia aeriphila]|uniref:Isoleucine--tRNA ligase n=1 Tax=Aeriscardovia aeriphila TaxID=218139 RepID=A0A261FBI5_9BIFI|nr:isoleucine--tRNA ligase [Aeriscardovia aeriphila]NYI25453.1 isoleucyl-tRNA synthetase [Aeriscardovia aeriphila]OZG56395.1 isoleucyl-tRNA synthetase [Aeriscardovia aeriphila]